MAWETARGYATGLGHDNQIKYCVDTLVKFDETFCLKGRTSTGDHDSFGQSETLPCIRSRKAEQGSMFVYSVCSMQNCKCHGHHMQLWFAQHGDGCTNRFSLRNHEIRAITC
eukprot:5190017-Amphidinium_carterae.1